MPPTITARELPAYDTADMSSQRSKTGVENAAIQGKEGRILWAAVWGLIAAIGWGANLFQAVPAYARSGAANMKAYMVDVSVRDTADLGWQLCDKVTDQDWAKFQKAAADLVELPHDHLWRRVAAEQARAKTAMWQDFTKKLADQARLAKTAADKKDQMAMAMAGDAMLGSLRRLPHGLRPDGQIGLVAPRPECCPDLTTASRFVTVHVARSFCAGRFGGVDSILCHLQRFVLPPRITAFQSPRRPSMSRILS